MRASVQSVLLAAFFLNISASAFAAENPGKYLEVKRESLAEKGLTFEASYIGDMVSVLQGGRHDKTTYLGCLDFGIGYDLEKAGLIPGGKLYVSGNNTHGGEKPSVNYIGDFQYVDNIEAPDALRLYEWWYEQSLFTDKASLLAGVLGIDSEFAITEYGSVFIHSSFGTPADMTGNVLYSGFHTLGPALRLKIKPVKSFDIRFGIFDGDPTDSGTNRHNVDYRFASRQGLMGILEGAYHSNIHFRSREYPSTIKFGSWLHTQNTNDLFSTDQFGNPYSHGNDYGFYGVLDQMVFFEKKDSDQGLGMFLQFGGAPDDRNTVDYYLGAGINYKGLLPKRDEDIFGVAAANAFFSERLRKSRDLQKLRRLILRRPIRQRDPVN